jgi:hypothetical protein
MKIYTQYQKYIAIAERMRLHERVIPVQEPVLAGSLDLPPGVEIRKPEVAAPVKTRRVIWRPMDAQEVVTRLRIAQN